MALNPRNINPGDILRDPQGQGRDYIVLRWKQAGSGYDVVLEPLSSDVVTRISGAADRTVLNFNVVKTYESLRNSAVGADAAGDRLAVAISKVISSARPEADTLKSLNTKIREAYTNWSPGITAEPPKIHTATINTPFPIGAKSDITKRGLGSSPLSPIKQGGQRALERATNPGAKLSEADLHQFMPSLDGATKETRQAVIESLGSTLQDSVRIHSALTATPTITDPIDALMHIAKVTNSNEDSAAARDVFMNSVSLARRERQFSSLPVGVADALNMGKQQDLNWWMKPEEGIEDLNLSDSLMVALDAGIKRQGQLIDETERQVSSLRRFRTGTLIRNKDLARSKPFYGFETRDSLNQALDYLGIVEDRRPIYFTSPEIEETVEHFLGESTGKRRIDPAMVSRIGMNPLEVLRGGAAPDIHAHLASWLADQRHLQLELLKAEHRGLVANRNAAANLLASDIHESVFRNEQMRATDLLGVHAFDTNEMSAGEETRLNKLDPAQLLASPHDVNATHSALQEKLGSLESTRRSLVTRLGNPKEDKTAIEQQLNLLGTEVSNVRAEIKKLSQKAVGLGSAPKGAAQILASGVTEIEASAGRRVVKVDPRVLGTSHLRADPKTGILYTVKPSGVSWSAEPVSPHDLAGGVQDWTIKTGLSSSLPPTQALTAALEKIEDESLNLARGAAAATPAARQVAGTLNIGNLTISSEKELGDWLSSGKTQRSIGSLLSSHLPKGAILEDYVQDATLGILQQYRDIGLGGLNQMFERGGLPSLVRATRARAVEDTIHSRRTTSLTPFPNLEETLDSGTTHNLPSSAEGLVESLVVAPEEEFDSLLKQTLQARYLRKRTLAEEVGGEWAFSQAAGHTDERDITLALVQAEDLLKSAVSKLPEHKKGTILEDSLARLREEANRLTALAIDGKSSGGTPVIRDLAISLHSLRSAGITNPTLQLNGYDWNVEWMDTGKLAGIPMNVQRGATSEVGESIVLRRKDGGHALVLNGRVGELRGVEDVGRLDLANQAALTQRPVPLSEKLDIWRRSDAVGGFIGDSSNTGGPALSPAEQVALLNEVKGGSKRLAVIDIETEGKEYQNIFEIGLSIMDPAAKEQSALETFGRGSRSAPAIARFNQRYGHLDPKTGEWVDALEVGGGRIKFSTEGLTPSQVAYRSAGLKAISRRAMLDVEEAGSPLVIMTGGYAVDAPKAGLAKLYSGRTLNAMPLEQLATGSSTIPSVESMSVNNQLKSFGAHRVHSSSLDAAQLSDISKLRLEPWSRIDTGGLGPNDRLSLDQMLDPNALYEMRRTASIDKTIGVEQRSTSGQQFRVLGLSRSEAEGGAGGGRYSLHLQRVEGRFVDGEWRELQVGAPVSTSPESPAFFASVVEGLSPIENMSPSQLFEYQRGLAHQDANRYIHRILSGEGAGTPSDPYHGLREMHQFITGADEFGNRHYDVANRRREEGALTPLESYRLNYYENWVKEDPSSMRTWEAMGEWINGDYAKNHEAFFEDIRGRGLQVDQTKALIGHRFQRLYGEGGALAVEGEIPLDPRGLRLSPRVNSELVSNLRAIPVNSIGGLEFGLADMGRDVVSKAYSGEGQISMLEHLGIDRAVASRIAGLDGNWSNQNLATALENKDQVTAFKMHVGRKAIEENIAVGDVKIHDMIRETFSVPGAEAPQLPQTLPDIARGLFSHVEVNKEALSRGASGTGPRGSQWFFSDRQPTPDQTAASTQIDAELMGRLDSGMLGIIKPEPGEAGPFSASQLRGSLTEDSQFGMNLIGSTPQQIAEAHGNRGNFFLAQTLQRARDPHSDVNITDDQARSIRQLLGWDGNDLKKFIVPIRNTDPTSGVSSYGRKTGEEILAGSRSRSDVIQAIGAHRQGLPHEVYDRLLTEYGDSKLDTTSGGVVSMGESTRPPTLNIAENTVGAAHAVAEVSTPAQTTVTSTAIDTADTINLAGVNNVGSTITGTIPPPATGLGRALAATAKGNSLITGALAVGGILALAATHNLRREQDDEERLDMAAVKGEKPVFGNTNITNINFRVQGRIRATAPEAVDHDAIISAVHGALEGFAGSPVNRSHNVNDMRDADVRGGRITKKRAYSEVAGLL